MQEEEVRGASQRPLEDWISTLAKGGRAKKRFQYCVNPNSSNQFQYLRAIQGHSGDNAVDPVLQDNVLLPKGFTECICHVGNASELNSEMDLIPGGKSLKRGRQAVFFTTVNPMDDGYHSAENQFERFRGGFWNQLADSNSIFFVAKIIFFERFEFLVCSKFNHTQCGRTCACAVACLCPQNSNSNVVVSLTIHDDIKNIFMQEM